MGEPTFVGRCVQRRSWRRGRAALAAVLLGLLLPSAAGARADPDPLRELAVQIAYRLDRELGEVDAAQRHALVGRLLLAAGQGELAPDTALTEVWLEWESDLERVERLGGLRELPPWHAPSRSDAVDALLASLEPAARVPAWTDSLWRGGQPEAGLRALTDVVDAELALALQAGTLAWARSHAPELWYRLLAWLRTEPEWRALVDPLVRPWLALPLEATLEDWRDLGDQASLEIGELLDRPRPALAQFEGVMARHTDAARAADRILDRRPIGAEYERFLRGEDGTGPRSLIALARAAAGLERGRYAAFIGVLVTMAIDRSRFDEPIAQEDALFAELERLDPVLLPWLDRVDPRLINVYQRTRQLLRQPPASSGERAAQLRELAGLEAALGLDTATLDSYLRQPFRERFDRSLARCLALLASPEEGPVPPPSASDFDACVGAFAEWSSLAASRPELAGQAGGPYEAEHLLREARLSAWQRINYWTGYLRDVAAPPCPAASGALANPLEWALGARALERFVGYWPQLASDATRLAIERVDGTGTELLGGLAAIRRCLGNRLPQVFGLAGYREAVAELEASLAAAAEAFRARHLRPGADLSLAAGAEQATVYRPERLVVGPCDGVPSCDMGTELEASKALFSLFPDAYLVADQLQLGTVALCYRDVAWVDREAELPNVRVRAMARYRGRLSFVLEGRYTGLDAPVFALRLVSPERYEYLFAANDPAVLADPCPRHLLDTQVHAELPRRLIELVPRRLTYMTSDRMHPARLFEAHWATGNEWRDWFVTGRGVEELIRRDAAPIRDAVAARLAELRLQRDAEIYDALLASSEPALGSDRDRLVVAMRDVELRKRLLAALVKLLAPIGMEHDAALRATLYGVGGLFDRSAVLRLRQRGIPAPALGAEARARYAAAITRWQALGERDGAEYEVDAVVGASLVDLRALAGRLAGSASAASAGAEGDDR